MNHIMLSKHEEIDANLKRFLELLPSLMSEHAGEYVLMRNGEVVGFFPSAIDAQIAGNERFEDQIFSIQAVKNTTENLGFFSYALHRG